ncbi:MAG: DUF2437 domain-containing protein [Candidatus Dadabacteria bacterium]|nr:DUF2437 domain-containing protein [Candidatus Dadabacteria bacterium]NIQ15101.1 DUF2437 domain-containing protein [Candidatus Dadabacteria bacterium]
MKFLRFTNKNGINVFGTLDNNIVKEIEGNIFENYKITEETYNIDDIKVLPPCSPSKILAVGLNYRDHAEEMKKTPPEDPMLFMKPSTAVIAHEDKINYPSHMSSRVDYEGELAVIIGKKATMVSVENSYNYIFGYTCINDITARDLQAKDIQFTRGKGFDTFAPIGPYIETDIDPSNINIRTFLNGEIKQNSNSSNLIFSVPELLSFISSVMTLLPGDIIATGTPSGINPMVPGDKIEVELEGIGRLINYVE